MPMKGFTRSERFADPPEIVFSFISDPTRTPQYIDGVTSSEKLTDGPIAVGSVFRETRTVKEKSSSAELTVAAYEKDTHFSIASEAEGIAVTYHYHVAPEGKGSRVEWTCELEASGLRRVMLPLVMAIMKKEDGDHLDKLKKYLDSRCAPEEAQ